MATCCFEQALLEETLQTIGSITPLKTIVPQTTSLALPPDIVVPLRQLLETAPSTCPVPSVEEDVLTGICLALAENRGRPRRTPLASRNYWRYVRKVRGYLEDRPLAEALSLQTLCQITGVGA